MSVKTNTNQLFVIRPESHLLCKRTAQQRQNIKSTYLKKRFFLHILKHKILHEKDFLSPNFSIWLIFLEKDVQPRKNVVYLMNDTNERKYLHTC